MSLKINLHSVALPPAEYFGGTRQKGDSSSHQSSHFYQNKCCVTDLCVDARWAGDDLQITTVVLVIGGGDSGARNVYSSHLRLPENRNPLHGPISCYPPISSFNPDYSFHLIFKLLHLMTSCSSHSSFPFIPFFSLHPSLSLFLFYVFLSCSPQFISSSASLPSLIHRAFNLFIFFVSLPLFSHFR